MLLLAVPIRRGDAGAVHLRRRQGQLISLVPGRVAERPLIVETRSGAVFGRHQPIDEVRDVGFERAPAEIVVRNQARDGRLDELGFGRIEERVRLLQAAQISDGKDVSLGVWGACDCLARSEGRHGGGQNREKLAPINHG